jgi:hypothetical protein
MMPIIPLLASTGRPRAKGVFIAPLVPIKTPDDRCFVSRIPANPLRPILFMLAFAGMGSKCAGSPVPWFPMGSHPLPAYKLYISGVTKDSAGAILGSCTVRLYRTAGDAFLQSVTSDATTGVYTFDPAGAIGAQGHYVVAYKAGSPDVAGTTVNTVMGQ